MAFLGGEEPTRNFGPHPYSARNRENENRAYSNAAESTKQDAFTRLKRGFAAPTLRTGAAFHFDVSIVWVTPT